MFIITLNVIKANNKINFLIMGNKGSLIGTKILPSASNAVGSKIRRLAFIKAKLLCQPK